MRHCNRSNGDRLEPNCCNKDGVLWDLIAVYPKHSVLKSAPSYIAGPVVKAVINAKTRLAEM